MEENRDSEGKFLPGTSGNPSGRPKISEKEKELREMIRYHFCELLEILISSKTRFDAYLKSPGCTMFSLMLAKTIQKGDHVIWKELLGRLMGGIPEHMKVESTNTNLGIQLEDLPKEQQKEIINDYLENLEKK